MSHLPIKIIYNIVKFSFFCVLWIKHRAPHMPDKDIPSPESPFQIYGFARFDICSGTTTKSRYKTISLTKNFLMPLHTPSFLFQVLTTTCLLFPVILPFPKWHINVIILKSIFWFWLLPLSITALRVYLCFVYFLLLCSVPLHEFPTLCFSILPKLRDICIASSGCAQKLL
jgi:hypothetical protein